MVKVVDVRVPHTKGILAEGKLAREKGASPVFQSSFYSDLRRGLQSWHIRSTPLTEYIKIGKAESEGSEGVEREWGKQFFKQLWSEYSERNEMPIPELAQQAWAEDIITRFFGQSLIHMGVTIFLTKAIVKSIEWLAADDSDPKHKLISFRSYDFSLTQVGRSDRAIQSASPVTLSFLVTFSHKRNLPPSAEYGLDTDPPFVSLDTTYSLTFTLPSDLDSRSTARGGGGWEAELKVESSKLRYPEGYDGLFEEDQQSQSNNIVLEFLRRILKAIVSFLKNDLDDSLVLTPSHEGEEGVKGIGLVMTKQEYLRNNPGAFFRLSPSQAEPAEYAMVMQCLAPALVR